MAYIPTEWKDGDTITAEKLNNLESGVTESIGNESGIINVGDNITFNQLYEYVSSGNIVISAGILNIGSQRYSLAILTELSFLQGDEDPDMYIARFMANSGGVITGMNLGSTSADGILTPVR